MNRITAPLVAHHKACDSDFANAESAVSEGNWVLAAGFQQRFAKELETHFAVEENELFPAFEAATGMIGGPTRMMRMEHVQMRSLLADLDAALASRDRDEFLGCAETLLMLMQQHNMKEENILYPMCDQSLGDQVASVGQAISSGLAGNAT